MSTLEPLPGSDLQQNSPTSPLSEGLNTLSDGGVELLLPATSGAPAYATLTGKRLPGDANRDGVVDQADYTVWYGHYGAAGGWSEGDFNADRIVDQADYSVWYSNYGSVDLSTKQDPSSPPVPEPLTLAGLALGVTGLGGYLRRRFASSIRA